MSPCASRNSVSTRFRSSRYGNFKALRSRLVFNVEDVPIVTSTAISFFIDAAKRAREFDGDAVLSAPTDLLRKSLKILDLHTFFLTFDNDDAAIAHFKAAALDDTVVPGSATSPTPGWREKLRGWLKG
ncbi:MAG: STAS domain-containing protein [Planctomycetota bacterium]|jgi:anti-anti-sigma regulatory factor